MSAKAKQPVTRCTWAESDPLLSSYHDAEWGVPEYDSRALWEKLMLDGFQAGLSWAIILRKRDAFRQAFKQFDPETVARFGERDVARLLEDAGIVRSRAKIEATIGGARAYLAMKEKGEDFLDLDLADSRRQAHPKQRRPAYQVSPFGRDFQGTEATRIQIRWSRNRLCVDASRRHCQRSCRGLLSERRTIIIVARNSNFGLSGSANHGIDLSGRTPSGNRRTVRLVRPGLGGAQATGSNSLHPPRFSKSMSPQNGWRQLSSTFRRSASRSFPCRRWGRAPRAHSDRSFEWPRLRLDAPVAGGALVQTKNGIRLFRPRRSSGQRSFAECARARAWPREGFGSIEQ